MNKEKETYNDSELQLSAEAEGSFEEIGHIGVDSGTIRIADPCHKHEFDPNALSGSFDKNGVSKGLLDVTIMTPHGDGLYPVYLDKKDKVIIIPLDVYGMDLPGAGRN